MHLDRRQFLGKLGLVGLGTLVGFAAGRLRSPFGPLGWRQSRKNIGGWVPVQRGANSAAGHLLRETDYGSKKLAPPISIHHVGCLIVGGGIAGLSAGWELKKRGFNDFWVVELESRAGGNSQGGSNAVSAFPWGAHYLPIPNLESKRVLEVLEDFGIIQGWDEQGRPIYDSNSLVGPPESRLFFRGEMAPRIAPRRGSKRGRN